MMESKITCSALKGLEITANRCRMKQAEEKKFWGNKAQRIIGCPCDKKGGNMDTNKDGGRQYYKTIGVCPKCGRPDQRLYSYHGLDVCGRCKNTREKARKRTAAITKSITDKSENSILPVPDALREAGMLPEKSKVVKKRYKEIRLKLDRDNKTEEAILQYLQSEAKCCRRSPNQQAIWILQVTMEGDTPPW